jgi:tight adherence protein B
MNWPGWLLAAAALAALPGPARASARVAGLTARGRLSALPSSGPPQHRAAGPRADPVAVVAFCCAGIAVGVTAGRGPVLGLAATVAAATASVLVVSGTRWRTRDARQRRLLVAVRLLVAELEAGAAPADAFEAAAGASPDHARAFADAAAAARHGAPVGDVLLAGSGRVEYGGDSLRPVGQAWRVAESIGTPVADVLARVAGDLAARGEQERAVAVALAGPRSSAFLLAGLPVLGLALGATTGAHPLRFLLDSAGGRLVCCVGVLFDAAGAVWTLGLISRARRA